MIPYILLSDSDVRDIIEMMHKRKIDKDPSLLALFGSMKKDICEGGAVSMQDFSKWAKANPSFASPIMILQLHLRTQIIGESFWLRLSKDRKDHPSMGKITFLKELGKDIQEKNNLFQKRQEAEEQERKRLIRLGKGKMGDSRDNLTRKQSVILGHFHLKSRESNYRSVDLNKTMPDPSSSSTTSTDNIQDVDDTQILNFDDAYIDKVKKPRRRSVFELLTQAPLAIRGSFNPPTTSSGGTAPGSRPPRKHGRSFYNAFSSKSKAHSSSDKTSSNKSKSSLSNHKRRRRSILGGKPKIVRDD